MFVNTGNDFDNINGIIEHYNINDKNIIDAPKYEVDESKLKLKKELSALYNFEHFLLSSTFFLGLDIANADGNVSDEESKFLDDFFKEESKDMTDEELKFHKSIISNTEIKPSMVTELLFKKYKKNNSILLKVINNLFFLAEVDGNISDKEIKKIKTFADQFKVPEDKFNAIKNDATKDMD